MRLFRLTHYALRAISHLHACMLVIRRMQVKLAKSHKPGAASSSSERRYSAVSYVDSPRVPLGAIGNSPRSTSASGATPLAGGLGLGLAVALPSSSSSPALPPAGTPRGSASNFEQEARHMEVSRRAGSCQARAERMFGAVGHQLRLMMRNTRTGHCSTSNRTCTAHTTALPMFI